MAWLCSVPKLSSGSHRCHRVAKYRSRVQIHGQLGVEHHPARLVGQQDDERGQPHHAEPAQHGNATAPRPRPCPARVRPRWPPKSPWPGRRRRPGASPDAPGDQQEVPGGDLPQPGDPYQWTAPPRVIARPRGHDLDVRPGLHGPQYRPDVQREQVDPAGVLRLALVAPGVPAFGEPRAPGSARATSRARPTASTSWCRTGRSGRPGGSPGSSPRPAPSGPGRARARSTRTPRRRRRRRPGASTRPRSPRRPAGYSGCSARPDPARTGSRRPRGPGTPR